LTASAERFRVIASPPTGPNLGNMTEGEQAGGHRQELAEAEVTLSIRRQDVRVAHRKRLLVDRHRVPPSERRERADRQTPALRLVDPLR
jgi:hypothetical protein